MAAAVPTTASTLEGQLIEIVSRLQSAEANATRNPNGDNNVTASVDTDAGTYSGTFSIPVTQAISASGDVSFPASSYLGD